MIFKSNKEKDWAIALVREKLADGWKLKKGCGTDFSISETGRFIMVFSDEIALHAFSSFHNEWKEPLIIKGNFISFLKELSEHYYIEPPKVTKADF